MRTCPGESPPSHLPWFLDLSRILYTSHCFHRPLNHFWILYIFSGIYSFKPVFSCHYWIVIFPDTLSAEARHGLGSPNIISVM